MSSHLCNDPDPASKKGEVINEPIFESWKTNKNSTLTGEDF
ncbi:hypothetical protein [Bacillus timonensis]|nr:hypothetical protein [Bacillus timonensis]